MSILNLIFIWICNLNYTPTWKWGEYFIPFSCNLNYISIWQPCLIYVYYTGKLGEWYPSWTRISYGFVTSIAFQHENEVNISYLLHVIWIIFPYENHVLSMYIAPGNLVNGIHPDPGFHMDLSPQLHSNMKNEVKSIWNSGSGWIPFTQFLGVIHMDKIWFSYGNIIQITWRRYEIFTSCSCWNVIEVTNPYEILVEDGYHSRLKANQQTPELSLLPKYTCTLLAKTRKS